MNDSTPLCKHCVQSYVANCIALYISIHGVQDIEKYLFTMHVCIYNNYSRAFCYFTCVANSFTLMVLSQTLFICL